MHTYVHTYVHTYICMGPINNDLNPLCLFANIKVKGFLMNSGTYYYWLFQRAWNVNRLSILPIQLLYCISILLLQILVTLYRMRKLKERYGITDFRKHANRMTFGEVCNSISCINTLLLHMYMCVHMPD